MSDEGFTINEYGEIERDDFYENKNADADDALYAEYSALEYEVLNNHGHPTTDPQKIARYHELKVLLKIDDRAVKNAKDALKKGIKNIKAKKSDGLSAAIAKYKKRENV